VLAFGEGGQEGVKRRFAHDANGGGGAEEQNQELDIKNLGDRCDGTSLI
jgi:hypothetical protein